MYIVSYVIFIGNKSYFDLILFLRGFLSKMGVKMKNLKK